MAPKTAATINGSGPLKKGNDPRGKGGNNGSGGGGQFLTLKAGKGVRVTCLVEAEDIISCEQCAIWLEEGNSPVWVYTGKDDPSHELGVDRKYRAFLPVVITDDEYEFGEAGDVKVWSMGKQAHSMLYDIAEAVGSLKGVEIMVKRTGTGLATRYTVTQTGKKKKTAGIEPPDVVSLLGPITPEEVRDLIAEKLNKESYDDVLASYTGKRKTKSATAGGSGRKPKTQPVIEDSEEEEEELEELDLS